MMRVDGARRAWALALVLLGAVAGSIAEAEAAATTFIVVRHTEKAGGADPILSEAGRARAAELARATSDLGIVAVYATPFKRTRETAAPAAAAAGVEVGTDPLRSSDLTGHYATFLAELAERHAGRRVLLVGHSNTVPVILETLGIEAPPVLGEPDYDDLFVVTVPVDAPAELLHLHYGEPSP